MKVMQDKFETGDWTPFTTGELEGNGTPFTAGELERNAQGKSCTCTCIICVCLL